jgi:hypothetical protein
MLADRRGGSARNVGSTHMTMTVQALTLRPAALALLAALAFSPLAGLARADDLPAIGCEAGDKIDGTSAAGALKQINAAGYTDVTELKKGCSNTWDALAMKDGVATHVSLSPQGVVRPQSD